MSITGSRSAGIESQLADILITLGQKANIQDVRACVLRTHFDEAFVALGEAIDLKASLESLQACETTVQVNK
jgi:phosphotransferase system IIB component